MVFCSAIGFLLVRVFKVVKSVNMPRRDYVRRVMPIGLLYAASLWLSNSAYLHLSVSFIQMTKALMPGLVYTTVRIAFVLFNCHVDDTDPGAHFKGVYMGTERFTYGYAANMLLIAVGVVRSRARVHPCLAMLTHWHRCAGDCRVRRDQLRHDWRGAAAQRACV